MNKKTEIYSGAARVSFSGDVKTLQKILKRFSGREGVCLEISTDLETVFFENHPFRLGGNYGQAIIDVSFVSDNAIAKIVEILTKDGETEK